jgi:hypothetical protein
MDDYTEDEHTEYEALVRRELMLLRAKKEAAELFRREEEARRMKEIEEELERQKQKEVDRAIQYTEWSIQGIHEWTERLQKSKSESLEKYAIVWEQYKREIKGRISFVNTKRKSAGLDPVDLVELAEVPEEFRF